MKDFLRSYTPAWLKVISKKTLFQAYRLTQAFYRLPVDKYDFQTTELIRRHLKKNSNCIDIGANLGHILMEIVAAAPQGKHFAFEPIPDLYKSLKRRFAKNTTVYNFALSSKKGSATFNYYPGRPAVSGFRERNSQIGQEPVLLSVQMEKLDDLIPESLKIDLLKIDVEGAEYEVLQGAKNILKKDKPIVLFEFGLGAADVYGTTPGEIFELFAECGLALSTIEYFNASKKPFSKEEFDGQFYKNYNVFFIAYDASKY
ncbi:MAG: methyltransferase FkbM family [Ferruginibacter sp.]|nr:methyltransferase FkbM family [Ferruginibacter sp.]